MGQLDLGVGQIDVCSTVDSGRALRHLTLHGVAELATAARRTLVALRSLFLQIRNLLLEQVIVVSSCRHCFFMDLIFLIFVLF